MSRRFFNQHAPTWDDTHSEQNRLRLQRMADRLSLAPGATLLDVGSGTGIFLPLLLRLIGERGVITALDYAEEMLKVARQKFPDRRLHYLQGSASDIPTGHEIFDAVICYSCFPHFKDKPKALAEMQRVLKDAGKLYICHTKSRQEINQLHHHLPGMQHDMIPDEDIMRPMMTRAGFSEVVIEDNADSYLASAVKKNSA